MRRRDFKEAKRRLFDATHLTPEERCWLAAISLDVHPLDSMYITGREAHYLGVGLSAARCIRQALADPSSLSRVRAVLDFPSGYGRVLRWLRVMFADAEMSCGDIDRNALDFCSRTFGVRTIASSDSVETIVIPDAFDLIWCGSLLTHFDEQKTAALLKLFCEHLTSEGLCVFTMHGRRSLEWIKTQTVTYGLSKEAQDAVVVGFEQRGFGYMRFDARSDYGISLAAESWTNAVANLAGPWRRVLFTEQGWDDHQDVYAFVRA